MTRCSKCNVTIKDNTTVCPLCQCVVEADAGATGAAYPDVWLRQHKLKLICNIALLAVIVASATLAIINFAGKSEGWWCLIPIGAMGYAFMVFQLVLVSRKGYRLKVLLPILFTVLLAVLIDFETGSVGWSLNYVLPSSILLVDVIIVMLMLTNLKNWHSYIIMEIGMLVMCLVPVILWITGVINHPLLTIIAVAITAFLLLGAVILGDRAARSELKRRFHIR